LNLVTGKKSQAHITSDDFRKMVESLAGGGNSYVSSVGTGLEASVSGTTLSVGKGMIIHRGCVYETANSGDTVSFQAGSSGMNRIDLVCVKYTRNNATGIENAEWYVIRGTATSGTPTVPSVPSGDLRDENATQDYCPVFKLTLTGSSTSVELMLSDIPIDTAYHKPASGIPDSDLEQSYATSSALNTHTGNTTVHVNSTEKASWNGKYTFPSGGIPSTDLSSYVQSTLSQISSAVQMDLIWTNRSSTSSWGTSSISSSDLTHPLSDYDAVLIVFKQVNQVDIFNAYFIKKGITTVASNTRIIGNSNLPPEVDSRQVTVSTSAISFGNGQYQGTTSLGAASSSNQAQIPWEVYGIKGAN